MSSTDAFQTAQNYIPGGVNSPVRSFSGVEGSPLFIASAKGAFVTDIDQNNYIDFVQSWGPCILGHADPDVLDAVVQSAAKGLSFGAPTVQETTLAKTIVELYGMDKLRLTSSGTEATMSAIRLARGFTQNNNIIKFEGCYHGHGDALLVKAGSGLATFGTPSSLGVPKGFTDHTLLATYNDLSSVEQCFEKGDVACVIIEPIAGNMGLIKSDEAFLKGLRELCDGHGALLIFDEVMSGFRASLRGACGIYTTKPDMVAFGKVIGGGMPIGGFAARDEVMECLSPLGGVYQAGTLSGNPVSVSAGLATIDKLIKTDPYDALDAKTKAIAQGFAQIADRFGVDLVSEQVGSMFGFFFNPKPVKNFADAAKSDTQFFAKFHRGMLDRGVYLACSAFECGFMSTATTDDLIAQTLQAFEDTLSDLTKVRH